MTCPTLPSARALLRAATLVMPLATLASGVVGTGAAVFATAIVTAAPAAAKTPGARYCFARACHRVMTLAETHAAVGKPVSAVTSFYDDCRRDRYNPCGLTSSGEAFRPGESNSAASPIYPDGTVVLVRNPSNGESAIVRINNAGPYWGNRTLDLSRAAGVKLGLAGVGVARVEVTVLRAPSRGEATYRRGRVYAPLPGHVGSFASMDDARIYAAMTIDLPDSALPEARTIAIAHADTTAEPVSPVNYMPITGKSRTRRLPADVIRVSALDPTPASSGMTSEHARTAAAAVPSVAVRAVEISGAALLVPAAGETTRVIGERASIVGSLRAGDFDRRGKSLLVPVGASEAAQDEADSGARAGTSPTRGPARLAAVSAADASHRGIETLRLERMPPLATRGERGWYRRAVASVSHVVDFAPGTVASRETRLAHWAALRTESFAPTSAELNAGRSNAAPASVRAAIRPAATLTAGQRAQPIDDDRMRRITRAPARARNEFDLIAA